MQNERIVEIAGTPVTITGPGIQYKGWTISPCAYNIAGGKRVENYIIERGDRRTICCSVEVAKREINARRVFSDAELEEIKKADEEIEREEHEAHNKRQRESRKQKKEAKNA